MDRSMRPTDMTGMNVLQRGDDGLEFVFHIILINYLGRHVSEHTRTHTHTHTVTSPYSSSAVPGRVRKLMKANEEVK